jgi:hypothetical protein
MKSAIKAKEWTELEIPQDEKMMMTHQLVAWRSEEMGLFSFCPTTPLSHLAGKRKKRDEDGAGTGLSCQEQEKPRTSDDGNLDR